jgi:hypothetical protein
MLGRLLGPTICEVPSAVRRFHASGHNVVGTGTFFVGQAGSRAGRLVARLMRAPRAVGDTPVTLSITRPARAGHRPPVERWCRTFEDEVMLSSQTTDGQHLLERVGPLELCFAVEVEHERLRFRHVGTQFRIGPLRLAIPRVISPAIAASVGATGDQLDVSVLISAPILGTLLHYAGQLAPRDLE